MRLAVITKNVFTSLDRSIKGAPSCANLDLAKSEKYRTRLKPRWKEIRTKRQRNSHSIISHRRENTEIILCTKKLRKLPGMTQEHEQRAANILITVTACRMKPGSNGKTSKGSGNEAREKPGNARDQQDASAHLGAGDAARAAGPSGKDRTPPSNEKMPAKRGKTVVEFVPYIDEDMLLSSDIEENERVLSRSTVARSGTAWARVAAEMINDQIQTDQACKPSAEGTFTLEQGARNISLNEGEEIAVDHNQDVDMTLVSTEPAEGNLSEREVMMLNEMGQREAALKARIEELERAAAASHQGRPNEARLPAMLPASGAIRRVEPAPVQVAEEDAVGALAALQELPPASQINIMMAVMPNDYPNSTITQEKLKHIEARLNKAIEQSRAEMGFIIEIGSITPRQGVVAIECRNVGSVNWLRFAVEDLEMGLRCEAASEAGLRPAFMIWVCDPSANFNDVATTLHWQGVPTGSWVLLKDYGPERQSNDPGSRIAILGRRFLILGNDELKQLTFNKPMKVQYKMYTTKATIRHLLGILDTRRTGNTTGKLLEKSTKIAVTKMSLKFKFKENADRKSTTTMNWSSWSSKEAPFVLRDVSTNTCRTSPSAARNKGLTTSQGNSSSHRKSLTNEFMRKITKLTLCKIELIELTEVTAATSIKNYTLRNYSMKDYVIERKNVKKGNKGIKIELKLNDCLEWRASISELRSQYNYATLNGTDLNAQSERKKMSGENLLTSPAITDISGKYKYSQQNFVKPTNQKSVSPTKNSKHNFMGKLGSYIHEKGVEKLNNQGYHMNSAMNIQTMKTRYIFKTHGGMQACKELSRNEISGKITQTIGQDLIYTRIKRTPDKLTQTSTDRRAVERKRINNATARIIQGYRNQACRNKKRETKNTKIMNETVAKIATWINAFKSCRGEEYPIENG